MLQNVVSVVWKSCEVVISVWDFLFNYSSYICFICKHISVTNMLEDLIWCFLNMRCEMEEDNSRLGSMDISNKVGTK